MKKKTGGILLAIGLAAVVSRTALTAVGVLQEPIREDVGLSYSAMGMLTTIPVIMYVLSAMGIGRLKSRAGLFRTMALGIGMLALGLTLRSWCGAVGLIVGTVFNGVGISTINVLIPAAIKEFFPQRVGRVTGFYSICMYAASATAAAAAVPVWQASGSWRLTLYMWFPFAVAALLAWFLQRRKEGKGQQNGKISLAAVLRRPITWMLALMMGAQSVIFYGTTAWLPAILSDHGFSAELAGRFTSVCQLGGIVGSVICMVALDKLKKQGVFCLLIGAGFVVEMVLLAFVQSPALLLFGAVLLGACCSSSLSAIYCVTGLRAENSEVAVGMTSATQTFGYPLAAVAPVLMGRLFDISGSWLPALAILALAGLLYAAVGLKAGGVGKKEEKVCCSEPQI